MNLNLLKGVKGILGAVAPTIGTALGGPMGGMAAKMVAEALGVDNDPKKIEKAIQAATPEQLVSEFGFPVVMVVGLGYFVYFVWQTITNKIDI